MDECGSDSTVPLQQEAVGSSLLLLGVFIKLRKGLTSMESTGLMGRTRIKL